MIKQKKDTKNSTFIICDRILRFYTFLSAKRERKDIESEREREREKEREREREGLDIKETSRGIVSVWRG